MAPARTTAHTNGTSTARRLDLDKLHRARAEAAGDTHVVVLGGREFILPASPPAAVLVGVGRLQAGNLAGLEDMLAALFGADTVTEVLAAGIEIEDFAAIFADIYGFESGESTASPG